jgi:kynurenine formamidase
MVVELGHSSTQSEEAPDASSLFFGLRAMVFESVGPVRHEVSIPFHDSQVRKAALLIETGWDQKWGTDAYWEPGPFLAEHLIFRMVRSGVRLVGVDFPVTERSHETRLITSGKIPIVENLKGVSDLPRLGLLFTVKPLKDTTGPIRAVRAFAEIT